MIWLWYSNDGVAMGKPWWVKETGREPVRAASVALEGITRTMFSDTGFTELPDGPRAVVVCDGEVTIRA